MIKKSFGNKKEEINYIDRIGAYVIIFSKDNKVAVAKTSTGYFLLGGGVENGETDEECIKRECLEEAEISVEVKDFICNGDLYRWSDTLKLYMHSIGNFYLAKLVGKVSEPIEEDHELVWLEIEEAYEKLLLEHQVWAIKQALILKNK
ncbi:NUDIX domain-containing protein [Clostridium perfringens]|uniref:NUDIX hydrolase n=1 Tax=Clostridium perfringens TaxID=1502 RepID=UPI000F8DF7A0|nr:NUDIX domain-containing protein [Clostridium perfringens]RUR39760.1 NUDIX domain-containing protein [Clostridium perfringens]